MISKLLVNVVYVTVSVPYWCYGTNCNHKSPKVNSGNSMTSYTIRFNQMSNYCIEHQQLEGILQPLNKERQSFWKEYIPWYHHPKHIWSYMNCALLLKTNKFYMHSGQLLGSVKGSSWVVFSCTSKHFSSPYLEFKKGRGEGVEGSLKSLNFSLSHTNFTMEIMQKNYDNLL